MHILALNAGSSTLKIALYRVEETREDLLLSGAVQRIGTPPASLRLQSADAVYLVEQALPEGTFEEALSTFFSWLQTHRAAFPIEAIVHRIVQGGPTLRQTVQVDTRVIKTLRQYIPYDPEHLPQQIEALEICQKKYPSLPQIACFDTAFHRTMPEVGQTYPLPLDLKEQGMIRYGFHGLSYEYILRTMQKAHPEEANGRLLIAHLGNGASLAAVRKGKPVDTTMGFSPAGGLMMSRRSGDLDPGVFLFLFEQKKATSADLRTLFNQESGLWAVSETSSEMKDLIERENSNPKAAFAIELFCYLAKKQIGALTAAMGGIDTLIFTAGIGERAALIREKICWGLQYLGIEIDAQKNQQHALEISAPHAKTKVRIIPTNEQQMMVRHAYARTKERI